MISVYKEKAMYNLHLNDIILLGQSNMQKAITLLQSAD